MFYAYEYVECSHVEWTVVCAVHGLTVSRESAEAADSTDAAGRGSNTADQQEDDGESSRSPDVELCMHQLAVN